MWTPLNEPLTLRAGAPTDAANQPRPTKTVVNFPDAMESAAAFDGVALVKRNLAVLNEAAGILSEYIANKERMQRARELLVGVMTGNRKKHGHLKALDRAVVAIREHIELVRAVAPGLITVARPDANPPGMLRKFADAPAADIAEVA